MVKKGAAAAGGSKKRKEPEREEEVDWDALLGEEMEGGVDLDEMGRIMVRNSRINYDFRSCTSALQLSAPTLQRIIADCQSVFGKDGGMEKTWWVASDGTARCALEQLALAVFKEHAIASYDKGRSGVEWWVQVREGGSQAQSIGFHWDKDEALVDDMGINVHPQISTVTYLTRDGSPTIVLDCTADTQYSKVKRRDISCAWVSCPCPLKHMSFDGRLLHGAPALQPLPPGAVRVTFLANVWLNHHPLSLLPLPSSTAKRLLAPLPSLAINMKHSSCSAAVADSSYTPQTFTFGPTGSEVQLTLPLPSDVADGQRAGQSLRITYTRDFKADIGPTAPRHKASKTAVSASPQQASLASAGGGGSKRRR